MRNFLMACLIGAVLVSVAGAASFTVAVDTSTISGTDGGIYFQFNPGLNADLASLTISGFTLPSPGVVSFVPPTMDGGVSGALPGTVTMDNSGLLNDYLQFLTFGPSLSFIVNFNLPSPLTGESGSEFLFGLTSADGQSFILTEDPSGFLGSISYDQLGAFTASTTDGVAGIQQDDVPEPSSFLMALPLLALGVGRLRAKVRRG
jgi:hypothetical protein